jgi:hypothetical protein
LIFVPAIPHGETDEPCRQAWPGGHRAPVAGTRAVIGTRRLSDRKTAPASPGTGRSLPFIKTQVVRDEHA